MMKTLSGASAGVGYRTTVRLFTQAMVLVGMVALLVGYTPAYATHPLGTPTDIRTDRFAGDNRYDTAGIIADDAFNGTATEVLLARGDLYPDALTGNYLAGIRDVPVLLMPQDSLSAETMDWLTSLDTDDITILGETAAISAANEQRLEDRGFDVDRIGGFDRYETAELIARRAAAEGGVGTWDGDRTAIVASGENFPDALVAGALSFSERFPLLLTRPSSLPAETRETLDDLTIDHVIIPGGTDAVSATVEAQIRFMGIETTRVAGQNRVTTATEFADFLKAEFGWTYDLINLARGDLFPDALTIGPMAGRVEAPLVLAHNPSVLGDRTFANGERETEPWLREHACEIQGLHFAGGTHALTTSTAQQAITAAEDCGDAVDQITLSPSSDTNQVGQDHTVTASVQQTDGDPAGNVQVRFEVTRNGNATGNPSTGSDATDTQGEATFTYTNSTAGTDTITACTNFDGSLPADCDDADVSDTASKTWQSEPTTVTPVVDSMTLSPSSDGNTVGDLHDMTAHLEDQNGDPYPGAQVRFEVTRDGSPTGNPSSGNDTSDPNGDADFTYTNDDPGTDTITACTNSDGSLPADCDAADVTATATKTWSTGEADSLTLTPFTDTNALGETHQVTATVEDQFDNPVQGIVVRFEVEGTTQQEATATTDADGQATFSYSSNTSGQDTITACANTDGSEPADCDTNTGPEDQAVKNWQERTVSRIELEPEDDTNPAGTQHQVTATVYDQFSQPFDGATVLFEVTGTNTDSGYGTSPSGENGQVTYTYTSNGQAGQDTISACTDRDGSDPGSCDRANVTDTSTKTWGATDPDELFLNSAEETNTVGQQHTVTATVQDEFGNRVPGAVVRFEVDGEFRKTEPTDENGQATFTYSEQTAQDDTITACTSEDGSAPADCPTTPQLTDSQTKHWVAGAPASLDLEPEADTNTVGEQHSVTATVVDEFGNAVSGADVRFEIREETTETVVETDANGQASFTYSHTQAENHTIDACTTPSGTPPADCPQEAPATEDGDLEDAVVKTWEAGAPASLVLLPAEATNTIGEPHEVTATVTDQYGNPVTDVEVRFEVTRNGALSLTAVPPVFNSTTGPDGHAMFEFTNTLPGTDTITACSNQDGSVVLACGIATGPSDTAIKHWTGLL